LKILLNIPDISNTIFLESGIIHPKIKAIKTSEWPTLAKRPKDSRLDCTKLKNIFDLSLPFWKDSLSNMLRTR
jgi:dTDP-4-dehydrorhamnose reductase